MSSPEYLYSVDEAVEALQLKTPIPLANLLYRVTLYPRSAVSSNLALVLADHKPAKASTLASVWYYDGLNRRSAPFCGGYRYFVALGTILDDLGGYLHPPYADVRLFKRALNEQVYHPLTEQAIPAALRYLYPYYDSREGFNYRLFLKQRTPWQREFAVKQSLTDYGCELNCEISDALEEIAQ